MLLLLSARVPVTVWPRRARVHLVLVAFNQSTNRFFALQVFHRPAYLLKLVRLSNARAVRCSTRTATTDVRVLLKSNVARVMLSVAPAAA